MWKYVVTIFALIAVSSYAKSECCKKKERSTSYLEIAADMISRAKLSIPECEEKVDKVKEEVKEDKNCPEERAMDCADWYNMGHNKSGIYKIWPRNRLLVNESVDAYCDMENHGGGWTVIQRRGAFGNPGDYFYKDWTSYKNGFGDKGKEFWLGNDIIFALTNQKPCSIRFDLESYDLDKAHANYSKFWIDDENNKYKLHISGYSGNASDGMAYHNNRNFTTKDQNNDIGSTRECATKFPGAWWYRNCYNVCLNGMNKVGDAGIEWTPWRQNQSLKSSEMKIRPENFVPKNSTKI